MRLAVTTPPTEPVSTATAKAHLRVTGSAEDTLVATLVTAARRSAERFTGRALAPTTFTATYDRREFALSGVVVDLPRGPVSAVNTVTAYDEEGDATVVDAGAYTLAGDRLTASEATDAADWPDDYRAHDALAVEYVAGYAELPEDIEAAVLLTVADLYENRSTAVVGTVVAQLPTTARSLLGPYKLFRL